MSEEVVLVDVHHQELVELHVLVPLQGRAVAGPAQPLQVDAQALGELRVGGGETGSAECREQPPRVLRNRAGKECGVGSPSLVLTA